MHARPSSPSNAGGGNIYKRLRKDLQRFHAVARCQNSFCSLGRANANSDEQTTCTPKSQHDEHLRGDWHGGCFLRGSVEEWDDDRGQPRAGASPRWLRGGVQQMSSRRLTFRAARMRPAFSPPEGRRGFPRLVGPSFLRELTTNSDSLPLAGRVGEGDISVGISRIASISREDPRPLK
jgi:hypothetical protein